MDQIIMNKFNIGDKVWFKLDSYGRKAEMRGTIRDLINVGDGWRYNIETSDHKHWNIKEKDINYSAPHTRDILAEDRKEYIKHDEETLKDFMNRIYGKSDFIQPFMLGDLVMFKDASKPFTFTVIDVIEFKDPAGNTTYSYKIKRTNINNPNSNTIVHIVDHNRLEKVLKFKGGYEYQRGDYVRFEYDGLIKVGEIAELIYADTDRGALYNIRDLSGNGYIVRQDKIKGINLIPEEHDDAADSLSCSLKRKLDRIHSNAVYGLNTDLTVFDEFVNIKEDNKMKKEQKKRNRNIIKTEKYQRTIKDITFNGPAVIVKFEPTGEDLSYGRFKGDKVVVVCKDGDKYDMKTGFLLAILKEFLNNQSYGNVLEKLDNFDVFDIPQVGKDERKEVKEAVERTDGFKFKVGDIVRLKSGRVPFEVIGTLTWKYSGREIKRYRLRRVCGNYTTYENENRLAKEFKE